MPDVYGFPLSPADMIRVETRHEAIDRMAEEAKAELREMIAKARAEHHVMLWALDAARRFPGQAIARPERVRQIIGIDYDYNAGVTGAELAKRPR